MSNAWIALMIGNSRLHWAIFDGQQLLTRWDTPHVTLTQVKSWIQSFKQPRSLHQTWPDPALHWLTAQENTPVPLCLASVVPSQRQIWQSYPRLRELSLADIDLKGIYPTLGIDRALALWGAGQTYGFPHLVIDAGTALTVSGGSAAAELVGGAILPGLRTQFQSLATQTAQLPWLQIAELGLPPRWAKNTESAIVSGISYTLIAGIRDYIQDWQRQYPGSPVTLTGGDATWIATVLTQIAPPQEYRLIVDADVIFRGMQRCFQDSKP